MDSRQTAFLEKFESASTYLGSNPQAITSVKVRDIPSYKEYNELRERIGRLPEYNILRVDGIFQGNAAYLVSKENNEKVILVEHETGLEILYLSSAIVSLLGIVPMVLQLWNWIKSKKGSNRDQDKYHDLEVRYFDPSGRLVEELNWMLPRYSHVDEGLSESGFHHVTGVLFSSMERSRKEVEDLHRKIDSLYSELSELKADAQRIAKRVGVDGRALPKSRIERRSSTKKPMKKDNKRKRK